MQENRKSKKRSATTARFRWGQERRLAFIEFRLQWEGRVNRKDLQDFFGTSAPQATNDLGAYSELQGRGIHYDSSERAYVRTKEFTPQLQEGDPNRFLQELLARWSGHADERSSFLGWVPQRGDLALPQRSISPEVLQALIVAIRDNKSIEVDYYSVRSGLSTRTISPHAFGWDGVRWHVRAYHHKKERFSDFVLTRIESIGETKPTSVRTEDDQDWHEFVDIRLGPSQELSEAQQDVIAHDYDMKDGEIVIPTRVALVFYLFQRLGLPGSGWEAPAPTRQLELLNREQLEPVLERVFPD